MPRSGSAPYCLGPDLTLLRLTELLLGLSSRQDYYPMRVSVIPSLLPALRSVKTTGVIFCVSNFFSMPKAPRVSIPMPQTACQWCTQVANCLHYSEYLLGGQRAYPVAEGLRVKGYGLLRTLLLLALRSLWFLLAGTLSCLTSVSPT